MCHLTQPNKKRFYGWAMVALTFYTQFIVMGTVFYSHGILLKPMIEDIGGSRLDFGWGFTVYQVVFSMMGLLLGQIIERVSIKKLMLCGAVVLTFGFYLLSQANSLIWFYLSFGVVMAAGAALLGGLTNTVLVSNWFENKRGTALGFSQFGVSASGMVMGFVTPWLIGQYGWRTTTELFALAPILLLAPVVWLWVVDKPEQMGLQPDGLTQSSNDHQAPPSPIAASEWSNRDALRTANFWLIMLVIGFCFTTVGVLLLRVFPHTTDQGYSSAQAALLLSLMAGCAAIGKPLCGWLGDRINLKLAFAIVILLQIAGVLLIANANSYAVLLTASISYGLGYGGLLPLWGALLGKVFGRLAFGRIMGLMTPMMLPFQTLGVPFADYIYDQTGSYAGAFYALAGVCLCALFLLSFIRLRQL